jgi:hypothetical protein
VLSAQTGTALVRHAPTINGTVEGSVRQMLAENVVLNGGAIITEDLLVPGTPAVVLNGQPNYAGTLDGSGSATPTNYQITLNGNATLRNVVRRTNPVSLPAVGAPPGPTGAATVNINSTGQSFNWSTVRHLTLNGGVGLYAVPAGSYGNFTANGGSGFILGTAGATEPAIYHFQQLTLNGNCQFQVAGPVVVTVAQGFTGNGTMGASAHPGRLTLRIHSGGFTLNGGSQLYGTVLAPSGTVIVNGNSQLIGGVGSDYLTVNGNGLLRLISPQAANQPPIVALTAPADGATYTAPATFDLAATASDADGTVTKVEFFQGTTKLGEDTMAPYAITVSNLAAGSYSFRARATDNLGAVTDSALVQVTVASPNQPPTVSLTSPADGALFTAPATVTLAAGADDADGTVVKVEFFHGTAKIGEALAAPFQLVQAGLAAGTHEFSARATDDDGAATTSATVTVTVVNPNQPPAVALIAPEDGATLNSPATFTLVATATDSDGVITQVEFFSDAVKLGEDLTAPYEFEVSALPPGTYSYLARATDNAGSSTDSAPVTITVADLNDAPVAQPQSITTPEDTPVAITLTGLDEDGDELSFAVTVPPSHGTLSGTAPNLTYTPIADYFGPDSFAFKANDGQIDSAEAVITLTVTPVNDRPVAFGQSVTLAEDASVAITLHGADVESAVLAYVLLSSPQHGTLSGALPNLTYTPAPNYHGPDSFSFLVNDGALESAPAEVQITVTPVNDPPVALSDQIELVEDTAVEFEFPATDADGDALTYIIVTPPSHGTLTGSLEVPSPLLTYTPAPDFYGTDVLIYRVSDGTFESEPAEISFVITPVNDAPVGADFSVTLPEDTAANFALVGTDVDGDPLVFTITGFPAHGTLSGTVPDLTYTPAANYFGPDTLTYTVSDGGVVAGPYVVTFDVTPVNDAPVAVPQSAVTAEDTPLPVVLTGTDADNDPLTFAVVVSPVHGTLSGTGADLVYAPDLNYYGSDSFSYTVSDGTVVSEPAVFSLTVTPVNDAPVAMPQNLATAEDTALAVALTGSDVDGDSLVFTVVVPPAHGTLSGTAPDLTYTPAPNYHGPDSFTFTVSDGALASAEVEITLTVTPVNDAPLAQAQTVETDEDVAVAITLAGSDVDGDSLTFSVLTAPAHGVLSGEAPDLLYTPATNYHGGDSFTFAVHDGQVLSESSTVTVNVRSVNDAPVASSQSVATFAGTAVGITLTATDVDGDDLTYVVLAETAHGTLSGSGAALTYTPGASFVGEDSFTFAADDGVAQSAPATVTITVAVLVNQPPLVEAGPDASASYGPAQGVKPYSNIILNHDEWTLTEQGFAASPYAGQFARNIANWFTGGRPGKFLAYTKTVPGSVDFAYTGPSLRAAMETAGHTWVTSSTVPFTLETLLEYT